MQCVLLCCAAMCCCVLFIDILSGYYIGALSSVAGTMSISCKPLYPLVVMHDLDLGYLCLQLAAVCDLSEHALWHPLPCAHEAEAAQE